MQNKEKILQRIKKLKAYSESAAKVGSVHEAENFMKSAINLMTEYNVSMIEVDATEINQQDEFKNWGYSEWVSYDDAKQGWEWKKQLMRVICYFNFCSYVYTQRWKTMQVYGNMENVDNTIWLYNYMSVGLFNLAQINYKNTLAELRKYDKVAADNLCNKLAYKFKRDFLLGTVDGIQVQLANERKKAASKVLDIIIYNDKALDTYLSKTRPGVETIDSKTPTVKDFDAYYSGFKTGLNFKVNKPLDGSSINSTKQLK